METGIWEGEKREDHVCEHCDSGEAEDERHVIVSCKKWSDFRGELRDCWGRGGEQSFVKWTLGGMDARGSEDIEKTARVIRLMGWMTARKKEGGRMKKGEDKRN